MSGRQFGGGAPVSSVARTFTASLPATGNGGVGAAPAASLAMLSAHVDSVAPHPVYDDMVDMRLIFENGLV